MKIIKCIRRLTKCICLVWQRPVKTPLLKQNTHTLATAQQCQINIFFVIKCNKKLFVFMPVLLNVYNYLPWNQCINYLFFFRRQMETTSSLFPVRGKEKWRATPKRTHQMCHLPQITLHSVSTKPWRACHLGTQWHWAHEQLRKQFMSALCPCTDV